MAYRSSSTTSFTGTTALTASAPSGATSGDYLGAILSQDSGGATITPPSGWTQVGGTSNDLTVDGQRVRYFEKYASGSDSYAWVSDSTANATIQVVCLSGRTGASTVQLSKNDTAQTSVITIGATGVTAANGDDLIWCVAGDQVTITDTYNYTSPSGFTERQDSSTGGSAVTIATQDGVSAGATGTLTGSSTITSGTERMGWGAFVITVPSNNVPTITSQPSSTYVNQGDQYSFSVSGTASAGSLTYQWQNNSSGSFANITGATSSTLSGYASNSMYGWRYRVILTDSNGSTTSNAVNLWVIPRLTVPRSVLDAVNKPVGPFSLLDSSGWTGIDLRVEKWVADELSAASGSGVTGTVNYTHNNDIVSASATTTVVGTLAKTNANDTNASSGSVGSSVSGTITVTNGNDIINSNGTTTIIATLNKTNTNDTVTSSGNIGIGGTVNTTNSNDIAAITALTTIIGSLIKINQNDISSSSGNITISGTLSKTNNDDVSTINGVVGIPSITTSRLPLIGVGS